MGLGAYPRVRLHLPISSTSRATGAAGQRLRQNINVALVDPNDAQRFARRGAGAGDRRAARPGARVHGRLCAERFHMASRDRHDRLHVFCSLTICWSTAPSHRRVSSLIGLPKHRILVQLFIEGV